MKILFSPIGTSDPMTSLGDGPMLHIVRHFVPDKVVLLFSPKMWALEDSDQRYTRALQLLIDHTGMPQPQVEVRQSEISEPHRYDVYIDEFRAHIQEIYNSHPGAQLLLNASSGTPGMKMALVVLDAFGVHKNTKAIQVPTPRGGTHKKGDREDPQDFDLDLYWELNLDNDSDATNRCTVVQSVNFQDLITKGNILALIDRFEYRASRELAEKLSVVDDEAKQLLEGCAARLEMDFQAAAKMFKGTNFPLDPAERLQEYVQALQVKLDKGQWVDFLRAMTPALTHALYALLEPQLPKNSYCDQRGRLDWQRIDADTRLRSVFSTERRRRTSYAGNDDLLSLLEEYSDQASLVKSLRKLRDFEKSVRNQAAHEITTSTRAQIEDQGGMCLDDVIDILMKIAGITRAQRGLYSQINDRLREYFE